MESFSLNICKIMTIWMHLEIIVAISGNANNSNEEFKLSLDSKWKYSITSSDGGATLKKGLPDSPVDDEIRVLVGGKTKLPCDVNPPTENDHPYLVLLSRGTIPIYSIDARTGQSLQDALHWKASPEKGIQESWFVRDDQFSGFLMSGVKEEAEGDYFCRVDFEKSPTRNRRIRLHVIVPPHRLIILNELQEEVQNSVGPYPEGASLRLECVVYGGKPIPSVTWWHKGHMVDSHEEEKKGDASINILTFDKITRNNLLTTVTCIGNNTDLAPSLKSSLTVDMLFAPKNVKIKDNDHVAFLREGDETSYTCDSEGSRPPAKITWWKNEFQLNDTQELILHDGNTIRSVVKLVPQDEDDQAILTCRAKNPLLSPTSVVEDARRLVVHYAPRIRLIPGQRMNISRVTEGDDVYLECLIESQPKENNVKWYHEGKQVFNNKSVGIIPSHESLVLQNVKKVSSGDYVCEATNTVGTKQSNVLPLNVKFVPMCTKLQQLVYGGGNEQLVNVSCSVEAYPDPIGFKWSFNTSAEHVDIPKSLVHSEGCRSTVSYTPMNHLDFGSLLCWAYNEVGEQKVPCVFQVVPASPPETPNNCSAWHEAGTAGEVVVACRPSWDGGLPQNFSLEVQVKKGGDILAALRGQPVPHFTVTGLSPGTEYLLVIIASNSQGSAPPIKLIHLTPIDIAEKRLSATAADGTNNEESFGSLIAVLCGVIVVLVTCFVFVVVLIRFRLKRRKPAVTFDSKSEQPSESGQAPEHSTSKESNFCTTGGGGAQLSLALPKFRKKSSQKKNSENISDSNSQSLTNLLCDTSPRIISTSTGSTSNELLKTCPTSSFNPLVFQQLPDAPSQLLAQNYHLQPPLFSNVASNSSTSIPPVRTLHDRNRLSSIDPQLKKETSLIALRNSRS